MEKYINTASDLVTGRAIPHATISVYRAGTGSLATLYEDDGITTKGNPLTSDDNAEYSFSAMNGRYDIVVSKTGFKSHTLTNVELYDKVQASDYGFISSASDNTGALQDAINSAQSRVGPGNSNGSIIEIPPGTHNFLGTINITNSFIRLVGAGKQSTFLYFVNGSADCIVINGEAAQGGALRDSSIEDLGIISSGKTAGATVKFLNTYRSGIRNVCIEGGVTLVDVGPNTNASFIEWSTIVPNSANSLHGVYWHCPGSGAVRSDGLAIHNVTIEGQWSNATCVLWEGFAATMSAVELRMLHANYGLRVINPSNSTSYYPQFLNGFDIEAEGFKACAVSIEAGAGFKISGSDFNNLTGYSGQGNADTYALQILPDIGFSYTRSVQISNSRIGLSRSAGAYINARDVQLSNVIMASTSMAGAGSAPAIKIDSACVDVQLANIRGEEYGGAGLASYAVQVESGATGVQLSNIDGTYCQSGAVNNINNAGNVSLVGAIEPGGIGSSLISYGNTDVRLQKSVSGSEYTFGVYNASSANNSVARVSWATGLSNAYVLSQLSNAAGTPAFSIGAGASVASATYTFPTHVFKIGSNTAFSIGAALGNYANDAAAAAGNVPLYGFYRNGGVVQQRIA